MKAYALLIILLATPVVTAAQNKSGTLTRRITDDAGSSITTAHVVIHPNNPKFQDVVLSPGSPTGEFSATLGPVVYDVFSSRCFAPIAKQFKVMPGEQQFATVELHMRYGDNVAEGCPMPIHDCCGGHVDTVPSEAPNKIPPQK